MELTTFDICLAVAIIWALVGLFCWRLALLSSKLSFQDEYELRKPGTVILICALWPLFLLWR